MKNKYPPRQINIEPVKETEEEKEKREEKEWTEKRKLIIYFVIAIMLLLLFTVCRTWAEEQEGILEIEETQETTQDENKDDLTEIKEKLDNIQEKTETTLNELKTGAEIKEELTVQKKEIENIKASLEEVKLTTANNEIGTNETGPAFIEGNYIGINLNMPTYLYKFTARLEGSNTYDKEIYFLSNSPNVQISIINGWRIQVIGIYTQNGKQQLIQGYKTRDEAIRYTNKILTYEKKKDSWSDNFYSVNLYTWYWRETPILFRTAPAEGTTASRNEIGVQAGYLNAFTKSGNEYTMTEGYAVNNLELVEIINETEKSENILTPYLIILITLGLIAVFRRKN